MADEEGELQPIIVKKIKKGGGHHGGAWKVAYADFVTAMMAFFLLLWLLNVTTDEQKNAISNYFDPTHPQVSDSTSGAGGVLGGLSVAPEGAMVTNVQPITSPEPSGSATNNRSAKKSGGTESEDDESDKKESDEDKAAKAAQANIERVKAALRQAEEERMKAAEVALEAAIASNPELAKMKDNLLIDMTPEGLRIQVIDQEGKPMFASGSARMFNKTTLLLKKVGEIITELPNNLSVRGHTDSVPYGAGADYTNWELSSDRANSSRRVLLESGLSAARIQDVVGKAATEPLVPEDPRSARNRRISIVLLKEELTNPDFDKKVTDMIEKEVQAREQSEGGSETIDADKAEKPAERPAPRMPKIGTFRKTPGAVEFP